MRPVIAALAKRLLRFKSYSAIGNSSIFQRPHSCAPSSSARFIFTMSSGPANGLQTAVAPFEATDATQSSRSIDAESDADLLLPEAKRPKTSTDLDENPVASTADANFELKGKRRKFAFLLSYLGKNYFGMQVNKGQRTVEGELFDALGKLKIFQMDTDGRPIDPFFQRASRTDKGVSASKQVVSMLIKLRDEEIPVLVQKLNDLLDDDIRVIGIVRATKGFDAKNWCSHRTYSYTLPSYAFAHIDEKTDESFRLTEERRKEVNEVLSAYLGTHNFFNFTSQMNHADKSCTRYIISCECAAPWLRDGVEFCTIYLKGQSFMLHQIRKMIGLCIAIVRGFADRDIIEKCWQPNRVDVPKAPGLGLVLEEVHYDMYNKKFGNTHQKLTWEAFEEDLRRFKEKKIDAWIIQAEREEKSMMNWLPTIFNHTFTARPADLLAKPDQCLSDHGMAMRTLANHRKDKEIQESLPSGKTVAESTDCGSCNDGVNATKEPCLASAD